jgi:hypothetical protein
MRIYYELCDFRDIVSNKTALARTFWICSFSLKNMRSKSNTKSERGLSLLDTTFDRRAYNHTKSLVFLACKAALW